MESVFTTSDPFKEEPLTNAFYHPTNARNVPFDDNKTCLGPTNVNRQSEVEKNMLQATDFLAGSNAFHPDLIPTKDPNSNDRSGSSKFDESWPSTERTSSPSVSSPHFVTSPVVADQVMPIAASGSQSPVQPNSTIAQYIQRFRNEPPKSREERLKRGKGREFWWAEEVINSSTPKDSDVSGFSPPVRLRDTEFGKGRRMSSMQKGGRPPASPEHMKKISMQNQRGKAKGSRGPSARKITDSDSETDFMQQRAQRLIEMSESTLSTSSTVGMPLIGDSMKEPIHEPQRLFPVPPSSYKSQVPMSQQKPAPEDDILHQWRLARKLEKARNGRGWLSQLSHLKANEFDTVPDVSKQQMGNQAPSTPGLVSKGIDAAGKPVYHECIPQTAVDPGHKSELPDSDKEIESKHCQTVSTFQLPPSGQNVFADYSCTSSHMHMACDIIPCPHGRAALEGQESFLTISCPRQSHILKSSTLENPLPVASPLAIGNASLRMPGKGNVDGTESSREYSTAGNVLPAEIGDDLTELSRKQLATIKDERKTDAGKKEVEHARKTGDRYLEISSNTPQSGGIPNRLLKGKLEESESDHVSRKASLGNAESDRVKEAIDQVISENTFAASISSSTSTASETEEDPQIHQNAPKLQDDENVISLDSDDDESAGEFSDDEILQVLRSRRQTYRHALR